MNIQPTAKYGVAPEEVEKKSLNSEEFKLKYDFERIKIVEKSAARYIRYDIKRGKKIKKKLHSLLEKGEIVYVLSSRLKKR